jgi:hypothetical protein
MWRSSGIVKTFLKITNVQRGQECPRSPNRTQFQYAQYAGAQTFLSAIAKMVALMSFLCLLAACQQAVESEVQIPYEEKIVVRGLLVAGELLSDVQISRTLPPLDVFSYEKVFLANAQASVTVDGKAYSLALQAPFNTTPTVSPVQRSMYAATGVRVESGKVYQLEVRWNGHTARAQTTVPFPADVSFPQLFINVVPSATLPNVRDTVLTVQANVKARSGEVYRIGAQMTGGTNATRSATDAVRATMDGQMVILRTDVWRNVVRFLANPATRITAFVENYDPQFFDYFQTRTRGGQPDILNPSGPNIEWNVSGDGVGVFVGMAVARKDVAR